MRVVTVTSPSPTQLFFLGQLSVRSPFSRRIFFCFLSHSLINPSLTTLQMVPSLWKACSDGDLQKVLESLNDSGVDVELKDHAGVTPLIEAVKNNHVDIVKVLLDRGANPMNPSSQGHLPEHYTSERAILDLLHPSQNETLPSGVPPHQPAYNSEGTGDLKEPFYAPPLPGGYPYFPTINPSMSSGNENGGYYPSSQPQRGGDAAASNGPGNLPPPEIARMIPCRYFPACRYGTQCLFAHPQTPYYPAPIPPLHYPTYDSVGNPFMHSYYQPPPLPFPQPDGIHLSPPPRGPPVMHSRSSSEVVSSSQGHFSANNAQPLPYGSITSTVYSHSGPIPVPLAMPPLPPLHHPIPQPQTGPQSPHNIYNASTSPVLPLVLHQDLPGPSVPLSTLNYPDISPSVNLLPDQTENYNIHPRETNRRGAGRRPSVGSRKPPCLFFPAGRCKNGNDCRFPHVLADNATTPTPSLPLIRGGPRPRVQGNGHNGVSTLETKLGASTRDDAPRPKNAFEVTNEIGSRSRYPQGGKSQYGGNNNSHLQKKVTPKQQRIPNPDEFPVLAGTITPPSRSCGVWVNGNGHVGLTAAQILQAPPTLRKEGNKESNMQDTTTDSTPNPSPKDVNAEQENLKSIYEQAPLDHINTRPAMSFAAATSGPVGVSNEVSVSA